VPTPLTAVGWCCSLVGAAAAQAAIAAGGWARRQRPRL